MEKILIVSALVLFGYCAWTDFRSWKIANEAVVGLVGLYAVLAAVRFGSPDTAPWQAWLVGDLLAGTLLFVLGFALWAIRMMGAGDAKLFFPIGLFVGWDHLFVFGLALAGLAIVAAVLLKFRVPAQYAGYGVGARIEEIRRTGKVPYGVLMVLATYVALAIRLL